MIVKSDIEAIIKDGLAKINIVDDVEVKFSAMPEIADFQYNNCFKLAKVVGIAPLELAQRIVDNIGQNDMFIFSAVKPAYINIKLSKKGLSYYGHTVATRTKPRLEEAEFQGHETDTCQ